MLWQAKERISVKKCVSQETSASVPFEVKQSAFHKKCVKVANPVLESYKMQLQELLDGLRERADQTGLIINVEKTKCYLQLSLKIIFAEQDVKQVFWFKFLESIIENSDSKTKGVSLRVRQETVPLKDFEKYGDPKFSCPD